MKSYIKLRMTNQKKSWLRMKSFSSTSTSPMLGFSVEEKSCESNASESRRFWKREDELDTSAVEEDDCWYWRGITEICPSWTCKCLANVLFILLLSLLFLLLPFSVFLFINHQHHPSERQTTPHPLFFLFLLYNLFIYNSSSSSLYSIIIYNNFFNFFFYNSKLRGFANLL